MKKITMIKNGRDFVRLHTEHIIYLEADNNSCKIYLSVMNAPLVVFGTFTHWMEVLGDCLVQIKRGIAINPEFVEKVNNVGVIIAHRDRIKDFAVAKKHTKELLSHFSLLC